MLFRSDGDGHTNLEEFAFGTDPQTNNFTPIEMVNGVITRRGSPLPMMTGPPNAPTFQAVFCRRSHWQAAGLSYKVRFSADLTHWQESIVTPTVLSTDDDIEAVSIPFPSVINVLGQDVKPQFFEVTISISL